MTFFFLLFLFNLSKTMFIRIKNTIYNCDNITKITFTNNTINIDSTGNQNYDTVEEAQLDMIRIEGELSNDFIVFKYSNKKIIYNISKIKKIMLFGFNININTGSTILNYDTVEKAQEVMEEIENRLCNKHCVKNAYDF